MKASLNTRMPGFRAQVSLWIVRLGLGCAIGGAAYLAAAKLAAGSVAGCGPGSGCDRVLSSQWASFAGIPVSIPAAAIYAALLAATWAWGPASGERPWLGVWVFGLGSLIVGAALWFTFLQWEVIHGWCRYCVATHACATVSAVWLLAAGSHRGEDSDSSIDDPSGAPNHDEAKAGWSARSRVTGFGLGALSLAVLILGQGFLKTPRYRIASLPVEDATASNRLSVYSGRFELDPRALPQIGTAGAPQLLVCLFDYTCEHCRKLHPMLVEAQAHFSGRVGILVLPAPLESACNPLVSVTDPSNRGACDYARIALAVFHSRPGSFREFDDWMFASDRTPSLAEARAKAESIVGRDALSKALDDPWVAHQLAVDVRLYIATSQAINETRLPQLIFADGASSGAANTPKELERLIESRTLLRRP